jgi:hypothetical protein
VIDDLLPHSSRAHKRTTAAAAAAEAPTTTPPGPAQVPAPHEPPTPTKRARRGPRRSREVVFGVVLAIIAAIGITWWATSSREPKPTLVVPTGPTIPGPAPSTVSGGGPPATTPTVGPSAVSPTATESGATRTTLLTTYNAMRNVYDASHSYQTISLQTLGRLLPNVTIEVGGASSTNSTVVSLLTPASNRVVLAVRDDSGCEWLRNFGSGAQVTTRNGVVITCSAAAAPTTGWTSAQ